MSRARQFWTKMVNESIAKMTDAELTGLMDAFTECSGRVFTLEFRIPNKPSKAIKLERPTKRAARRKS